MDVVTNAFCAGGNVLGNGTWMNVGGNLGVTYGGLDAQDQTGAAPYFNPDGGKSVRLLNPCDDSSCNWFDAAAVMTTRRWYPTLETLEDGTMIIIGGCLFGGYVNDAKQTNPTYEFFPSKGDPIGSPILDRTLPTNLYPLTWLLPSGNLLIQSNWETVLLDYKQNREYPLDNITDAVRTYPASAGTVMLPLTPSNNWTATVLFCGGLNLQSDQWVVTNNIAALDASASCVKITPDISSSYVQDDPLPEGRTMGNLILLPDGRIFCLNGAAKGSAGYGNTTWAIGQSFSTNPLLSPAIYDPNAPAGSRWSRQGLSPSNIPRMYHSSATLLPDGSIWVSGSNPNADYTVGPDVTYATEYRVERFYPSYYNERRPQPQGLLQSLSYGGPFFNVTLTKADLFGDVNNLKNTNVVVIRPGFSTHTMNMGQRSVTLSSTYTGKSDGSGVLHVSQLPPNPAILVPGPAYLFVVVKGVPSVGVQIMVGSGQLGTQTLSPVAALPSSTIAPPSPSGSKQNGSTRVAAGSTATWTLLWTVITAAYFFS